MSPDLEMELHSLAQAVRTSNSRQKKADQSYRPRTLPPGRSGYWPTVVIDAAFSESGKSKLAADARWWLSESAGDVKTALTIAVHQVGRQVIVEKWELVKRPTRQGGDKRVCEVVQRVTILQKAVDQPIHVTGSSLEIPFEHLFLRPAGLYEGDIVFDAPGLEKLATLVWGVHANV